MVLRIGSPLSKIRFRVRSFGYRVGSMKINISAILFLVAWAGSFGRTNQAQGRLSDDDRRNVRSLGHQRSSFVREERARRRAYIHRGELNDRSGDVGQRNSHFRNRDSGRDSGRPRRRRYGHAGGSESQAGSKNYGQTGDQDG